MHNIRPLLRENRPKSFYPLPGQVSIFISCYTITLSVVKYYIINKENEMHLIPVKEDMDTVFRLLNDQKIIVCADSLLDAFKQYDDLPMVIDDPF